MSEELSKLEAMAGAIVRALTGSERRALLRRMARMLAASQRQRIAAQRQPDGSAFEPRKQKSPPISSRGPACFLYPADGGARRVIMRSFTWGSDRKMTGYDIEVGGMRSFQFEKVIKWLPVPEEHRTGGAGSNLRRRGGVRSRTMFRRLSTGRYLRSDIDNRGFWVGFSGKASEIATIHQRGLRDKPALGMRTVSYPRRELIGTTEAEQRSILHAVLKQISL